MLQRTNFSPERESPQNNVLETSPKLKAFEEVMRSVLFRFQMERETVETFFNGRSFNIDNTAGALVALGQCGTHGAEGVYKDLIGKK